MKSYIHSWTMEESIATSECSYSSHIEMQSCHFLHFESVGGSAVLYWPYSTVQCCLVIVIRAMAIMHESHDSYSTALLAQPTSGQSKQLGHMKAHACNNLLLLQVSDVVRIYTKRSLKQTFGVDYIANHLKWSSS